MSSTLFTQDVIKLNTNLSPDLLDRMCVLRAGDYDAGFTDGHKRLFRDSEKIERSSKLLWFGADCVCLKALKGQRWASLHRAVSSLCPPGRTSFHCGFDTTVTASHTHTQTHADTP